MKIEKVEAIPLVYQLEKPIYSGVGKCTQKQLLIVRIYTDNGMVGIGEAATYGGPVLSTMTVLEQELTPLLIGENPLEVEKIWHKCFYAHFQHGRSGIFISALSGVDIALWDLVGKVTGQPLYRLLGGFKKKTPVYASAGFYMEGKIIHDFVEEAVDYAGRGFHGVKIKVARTQTPFSLGFFQDPGDCKLVTMEEDIERVAEVKRALGKDCDLMLDANAAWSYPDALHAGRAYDKIGIHFLEEPVRTDDYEGSARLAADLDTRIIGYETECLTPNYMRLIRMGAVDLVQPDLSWCGGITEARRIAALAYANYMECTAHVWSSGILLAASAHFTCAIPNGAVMEYDMSDNVFRNELLKNPIIPDENGMIVLEDSPGLGIELREDMIEKYRIIP